MSLDETEPVYSVLTFLSGYDVLEYSWVESYNSIRALPDFIRDVTKDQQWRGLTQGEAPAAVVVVCNVVRRQIDGAAERGGAEQR